MKKIFHETFISPFEKDREQDALIVLNSIRECHPESSGWVEIRGFIEKLPNGKYRAVREHIKK